MAQRLIGVETGGTAANVATALTEALRAVLAGEVAQATDHTTAALEALRTLAGL